jgi:hypothetical protein
LLYFNLKQCKASSIDPVAFIYGDRRRGSYGTVPALPFISVITLMAINNGYQTAKDANIEKRLLNAHTILARKKLTRTDSRALTGSNTKRHFWK